MANLCKACGNELPDGAELCARCGAAIEAPAAFPRVSAPSAPEVPAAPQLMPTPAEAQAALEAANTPAYRVDNSLTGIGGWLILVAINLALAPFYSVAGIYIDLRGLYNPTYNQVLAAHHGLAALILFEATTNTVFLFALIGLNVYFYARKQAFPKLMIAYLAIHLAFVVLDHFATVSMHLGHSQTQPFTLIRAFVYTLIWIPYFMNSIRVEQTFTR